MQTSKVGLLSVGNLESVKIPSSPVGPVLVGSNSGASSYLSEAVRDALKDTKYDTLVDAEVTTRTGLFVWQNGIEVKGIAIDSTTLGKSGGVR